jgi:hypothetical protein
MLKSAVISALGLTAVLIAVVALYLASGRTFGWHQGDGGEGAVVETAAEGEMLSGVAHTVEDPDPDDLYCRGARYSTKGVALEVVKLVGDDRCFPASQLGEPIIDDSCGYGYWTGDVQAIDGTILKDMKDKCGTITVQDIRMRSTIYIDPGQFQSLGKGEQEAH